MKKLPQFSQFTLKSDLLLNDLINDIKATLTKEKSHCFIHNLLRFPAGFVLNQRI